VREACAEALCQAILDRHSHAVPAGVLVEILGGIAAPMILQLRDHTVEAINKALPEGAARLFTSREADVLGQQQRWESEAHDAAAAGVDAAAAGGVDAAPELPCMPCASTAEVSPPPAPSQGMPADARSQLSALLSAACAPGEISGGGTVSVLMECLSALCKSFLQHLQKLVAYPSFDKLWLCILQVLGHFLDSEVHGAEELLVVAKRWGSLADSVKQSLRDLYAMLGASSDNLVRLLRALRSENVFAARPGLLEVTMETIKHFDGYDEILREMNQP
jgi:hypothetical protein